MFGFTPTIDKEPYFMLSYLKSCFNSGKREGIYDLIRKVNSFKFIQLAKDYFNNNLAEEKKWDELIF